MIGVLLCTFLENELKYGFSVFRIDVIHSALHPHHPMALVQGDIPWACDARTFNPRCHGQGGGDLACETGLISMSFQFIYAQLCLCPKAGGPGHFSCTQGCQLHLCSECVRLDKTQLPESVRMSIHGAVCIIPLYSGG